MRFIDMTGQRFGRLKVICRANRIGPVRWHCECQCGNKLEPLADNLRKGDIQSCGCLRREMCATTGERNSTHRYSSNGKIRRTYKSWQAMKYRCSSRKYTGWQYYGGRGIRVCKRWQNSFENFLADMGDRPRGKTLDRYPNNDGNYQPGNCRWATAKEQVANRRCSTS